MLRWYCGKFKIHPLDKLFVILYNEWLFFSKRCEYMKTRLFLLGKHREVEQLGSLQESLSCCRGFKSRPRNQKK